METMIYIRIFLLWIKDYIDFAIINISVYFYVISARAMERTFHSDLVMERVD